MRPLHADGWLVRVGGPNAVMGSAFIGVTDGHDRVARA